MDSQHHPGRWRLSAILAVVALGVSLGAPALADDGAASTPGEPSQADGGASPALPDVSSGEAPTGGAPGLESTNSRLTLRVSAAEVHAGERVLLTGTAMEGPTALAGEAVTVQQLVDGAWIPAARTFAGQDGRYSAFAWIDGAVTLRPVVRQSDRVLVGTNATVTVGAARRTLHQRATELRGIYGTTSAARALSAKQRAKAGARSATSVHYRNLDGGPMLVEIARGATTETWLVKGAIKRYYQSHGGPSGNLGLPIQDPRCSLPGGGCLQTFTRGTVYSLPGEVAATPLTGAGGDIVAALRTQVGFKQQGSHDGPRVATKYQLWADSEAAWCSIFLAWGAYRTGHDDAIPKHRHFREYRDYLRRDVKRLRGPTPGALVIMNGGEVLGHAAIVTSVDKHRRTIQIIDGNWSMRVRETRVPIAKNMEFYWPY